nr:PEP-CTERM sorting domain-containing protein [Duganella vulcania]
MAIKLFAAAAVVALTVFATQAHAAQMWTVTTTGTIDDGRDYAGLFGLGRSNLAGLSFTQSVTASLYDSSDPNYKSYFSDTITIDGHTVTLSPTIYWGDNMQLIENGVSKHNGSEDAIAGGLDAYIGDRRFFVTQYAVNYTKGFVPSTDYGQVLGPIDVSDPSFIACASFGNTAIDLGGGVVVDRSKDTWFSSWSVKTISVNAVPEPEAYAMLLAGLGLVGFAARRKRMAA